MKMILLICLGLLAGCCCVSAEIITISNDYRNSRVFKVNPDGTTVTSRKSRLTCPGSISTNIFILYYFSEKIRGGPFERGVEDQRYCSSFAEQKPYPETLPVEQDPQGHWGNPAGIFQLSLRFRKEQYKQGEIVPAVLILRNLSLSRSPSWLRNQRPDNGYILSLSHGTNTTKWFRVPKNPPKHFGNRFAEPQEDDQYSDPGRTSIVAHSAELTVMELNDFFNISETGEYTLAAQMAVPTPDGKGMTNVASGTARFEVIGQK